MELTESPRAGDFILSLATRTRSLENGVLATGNDAKAGTVLGQVTASGEYVPLAPAAVDGSEAAAGVLMSGANATDAAVAVVVVARDAEVKADALIWPSGITAPQQTTAVGELDARGIVLR